MLAGEPMHRMRVGQRRVQYERLRRKVRRFTITPELYVAHGEFAHDLGVARCGDKDSLQVRRGLRRTGVAIEGNGAGDARGHVVRRLVKHSCKQCCGARMLSQSLRSLCQRTPFGNRPGMLCERFLEPRHGLLPLAPARQQLSQRTGGPGIPGRELERGAQVCLCLLGSTLPDREARAQTHDRGLPNHLIRQRVDALQRGLDAPVRHQQCDQRLGRGDESGLHRQHLPQPGLSLRRVTLVNRKLCLPVTRSNMAWIECERHLERMRRSGVIAAQAQQVSKHELRADVTGRSRENISQYALGFRVTPRLGETLGRIESGFEPRRGQRGAPEPRAQPGKCAVSRHLVFDAGAKSVSTAATRSMGCAQSSGRAWRSTRTDAYQRMASVSSP